MDVLEECEKQKKILESESRKIQFDKEEFELEKKKFDDTIKCLKEKINKMSKDRDSAIISRDRAVKEKNESESKCQEYISQIKELENNYYQEREKCESMKKQLTRDVEWYKNYAIAIDKKIIGYFKDKDKKPLKNHYDEWLNNGNKLSEIREHFSDFQMDNKEKEAIEIKNYDNKDYGNDEPVKKVYIK